MNKNELSTTTTIGGYSAQNLSDRSIFFSKEKEKLRLSFKIDSISSIDGSELLKFKLGNGNICRFMRFTDPENFIPSLTFDIVDTEKNEIILKAAKVFHNASGIGGFLLSHNFITQWEIMPMDKIARSFVLGDRESFLSLIDEFNIKLSQEAAWYIKNELE